LRATLTDTAYDTWFGEARPQSVSGGRLVVEVPNDFTRDWIEGHFLELVSRASADTDAGAGVVSFAVSERPAARPPTASDPAIEPPEPPLSNVVLPEGVPAGEGSEVELNPKYTFDLFVIGSSNRFAHAAALAVAEAPAQAYNPLFIYGGTGLGKTHLLQAIGHYVRQHSRRLTTRYVTSETFMN
jgi:chromosomal replication initiator protein